MGVNSWLSRRDLHNQRSIEASAGRARAGRLRTNALLVVWACGMAVLAAICVLLAVIGESDDLVNPVILAVIAVLAVCGLIRATWRAEVRSDEISFRGLLCPLPSIPLAQVVDVTVQRYGGSPERLTFVPRRQRQCVALHWRAVTPTRLKWFWRRPPWGDEDADHPDLLQFVAAVRHSLPTQPDSLRR